VITNEMAVNVEVYDRDQIGGDDLLGRFSTFFSDLFAFLISNVIFSVKRLCNKS